MSITVGTGSGGLGTSTLSVSPSFGGAFGQGTPNIPNLVNSNSPCQAQEITLASGSNSIALNPLSGWVLILIPPASLGVTVSADGQQFYGVWFKGLAAGVLSSVTVVAGSSIPNVLVLQG